MVEAFGSATISDWMSVLGALVAVAALVLTGVGLGMTKANLATAREQAHTASAQTALQREIYEADASPSLWFDFWLDEEHAKTMVFRLGNSGKSVATDVRVIVDPPLIGGMGREEKTQEVQGTLLRGITSLPPQRVMEWSAGATFAVVEANDEEVEHVVTLRGNGPFGPLAPVTYTIRLSDMEMAQAKSLGTMFGVTSSIQDLTKAVREHQQP